MSSASRRRTNGCRAIEGPGGLAPLDFVADERVVDVREAHVARHLDVRHREEPDGGILDFEGQQLADLVLDVIGDTLGAGT